MDLYHSVNIHYVTRIQALPYSAEDDVFHTSRSGARGAGEYEKHRPRPSTRFALSCIQYFMQGKDVFCIIPRVFGKTLANWWIFGVGIFYRTWTVKLMNCACASASKVSFTIQVRWKSPPQIFLDLLMLPNSAHMFKYYWFQSLSKNSKWLDKQVV